MGVFDTRFLVTPLVVYCGALVPDSFAHACGLKYQHDGDHECVSCGSKWKRPLYENN